MPFPERKAQHAGLQREPEGSVPGATYPETIRIRKWSALRDISIFRKKNLIGTNLPL